MPTWVARLKAVVVGSLAVAVGINLFLIPYRLIDGGFIGIGLLMQYYFGVQPGRTIVMLSLPLFLFVFFYNPRIFFFSLCGIFTSSLFIDLLSPLRNLILLPLPLHAIYGGALIGSGIGMMLAYEMNTGGTDLIAQLLSRKIQIPVALIIFIIDFLILLMGIKVIGVERTLYSLITIIVVTFFTFYFSERKVFGL